MQRIPSHLYSWCPYNYLIVFMGRGAGEISTAFGLNRSFGDILTGVILFFVIGSEFFINYQVHFRKSSGKEASDV